jgi:hypothetical protein
MLYYLDVELTKILHLNVTSEVAPHMCVFQTNCWNINPVPFILKRWTCHSNSHIFVCVCHILPDKIAEALIVLLFLNLSSILQELVTRKQKILAEFYYLIRQVCFLTYPIICIPSIFFYRSTVWFLWHLEFCLRFFIVRFQLVEFIFQLPHPLFCATFVLSLIPLQIVSFPLTTLAETLIIVFGQVALSAQLCCCLILLVFAVVGAHCIRVKWWHCCNQFMSLFFSFFHLLPVYSCTQRS